MDSKTIIRACKNGDEDSFRILINSYSEFAFSTAFKIMHDEDEAKDIVQESFISVWKNIKNFDSENKFSNWLYKIIINKCFDSLRRRKRRNQIYFEELDQDILKQFSDSEPDVILNNKEFGKIMLFLTGKLSAKQRMVFILSAIEGIEHDEIYKITGMSKANIKSNLNHARRKIEKMIEKYF